MRLVPEFCRNVGLVSHLGLFRCLFQLLLPLCQVLDVVLRSLNRRLGYLDEVLRLGNLAVMILQRSEGCE